jgi:DNA-binding NtrC family response regulator
MEEGPDRPRPGAARLNSKILLVDDALDVRTSVARMLARRYDVITASDAREAIDVFAREGPFPVVVSDYSMPGMNGIQLLREVHAHAPDTVGILLTGVPDLEMAAAAVREQGIFRFLSKPCGFEILTGAIDEALARSVAIDDHALEFECLKFTKDALAGFNQRLESVVDRQTKALLRLHEFATELTKAAGLREIVRASAQATSDVLGGRGVHVQLWDPDAGTGGVEAGAGPR